MNSPRLFHRREALRSLVGGSLLMPGLLSRLLAESGAPSDPLSPKAPQFPARAKRVIFIFSNGGASHMDTFDPKPALFAADGKSLGVGGGLSNQQRVLLKPGWQFKPGGRCGTMVSDLFPHLRECMDDICVIRSMKGEDNEHYNATLGMHTGSFFFSSWLAGGGVKGGITYGATDEIASTVVENKVHVHDFHATILHLLGLNHENLTYRHGGRDYRLTDVSGNVVKEILS